MTIRSGTHDILLTFHSNHHILSCTVSETNDDLSRKSQIFPPPAEEVPLVIFGICAASEKTGVIWSYQMVEKVLR